MIVNIILCVLFALQTIILLTLTIVRNREINKEIKKSDDLLKSIDFEPLDDIFEVPDNESCGF